jgi:hypothetical protein
MLSFRGRYFCIKCYNQLMEKLDWQDFKY